MTVLFESVEACVDHTIARLGKELRLAAPLGLGKPVQLLNAFFQRALVDPELELHIYTALSLELPTPGSDIEADLAGPIIERLFGDYEPLQYMEALRAGTLPPNIQISEVYFKAGSMKGVPLAQQNYISSNYTHIARDLSAQGVNVLVQMVAARETEAGLSLSLSCNPDVTLDLMRQQREHQPDNFLCLAQVHPELPFMEHDAELPAEAFDGVVRNPAYDKALFAVPNSAVPLADYATALHASRLVVDGGTLQIGIGALGDALAHSCILRHQNNAAWRAMVAAVDQQDDSDVNVEGGIFDQGLYVCTEMFVYGMLRLLEAGILKRRVYDNLTLQEGLNSGAITTTIDERLYNYAREQGLMPRVLDAAALEHLQYWGLLPTGLLLAGEELHLQGETLANDLDQPATRAALLAATRGTELRHGRVLHGGFFLGPRLFYRKLRELDVAGREQICMTSVQRTNQLLRDYPLYCAQRRDARFINTGMMVSLGGAVTSDALEDGTVISGVGGQYNFVAMAHELPGARSILCIRSTRGSGRKLQSNILPFYGHTTIPRHLRDIIVTEYGIADLRGQSDAEVCRRLIAIADSRFQQELADFACEHGKLPADYEIPAAARNNNPERLAAALQPWVNDGLLPEYPLGTELTAQEQALSASLRKIKALSEEPTAFLRRAFRALLHQGDAEAARPYLERIQLEHPDSSKEFIIQQLLLLELEQMGLLKAS